MKTVKIIGYILYLTYIGVTLLMGLYFERMISHFGLIGFFTFFQKWIIFGNLFFVILLVFENIQIWNLKKRFSLLLEGKLKLKKLKKEKKKKKKKQEPITE
jgi:hypothetical protein